jgi:uncharacterized protein with PQ loop repeat
MGYAAIFFGILGSWGLYKQARMIWSNKSAQSVSGTWVITFLAMFAAFLIYGVQQGSFPMKFQGWLRVAFSLPVTLGFFIYGITNKKHWALVLVYALLLSVMNVKAMAPVLFTLFSFLGVWSSFVQAYTIFQNRSRGKVAVELQIIYLLAIICWLVYGFVRKDVPLVTVSVGFTLSYLSTVIMWFRYP